MNPRWIRVFWRTLQVGEFGSLWAEFVERHARIGDVAAATYWLDDPCEDDRDEVTPMVPPNPSALAGGMARERVESPAGSGMVSGPYLAPIQVGRNDPCPCGSGKKYKKCCGR